MSPEEMEIEGRKTMERFRKKLDKLCEKTGVSLMGVMEGTDHSAFYMNGTYCVDDVKAVSHCIMEAAFDIIQAKTIEVMKDREK